MMNMIMIMINDHLDHLDEEDELSELPGYGEGQAGEENQRHHGIHS